MRAAAASRWLRASLLAVVLLGCSFHRTDDQQAAQAEFEQALAARPKGPRSDPEGQNGTSLETLLAAAAPGASPRATSWTGLTLKGADVVLTDGARVALLRGGHAEPLLEVSPAPKTPSPALIAVDGEKGFVVVYPSLGEVRRVAAPDGKSAVVASALDWPTSPVLLPDGSIVVAETGAGRITRLDASGARIPVATGLLSPIGIARSAGRLLVVESSGGRLLSVREGGAPVVIATGLARPIGVGVDRLGRVYVAQEGTRSIERVDGDGSRVPVAIHLPFASDETTRSTGVPVAISADDAVVLLAPATGAVFRLVAP
jgi:hypothetical protein